MTQHTDNAATAQEEQEFDTVAFAKELSELTWDLKGLNTVAIDLRGIVSYTDFVIVTTATSERQVQAIARHVQSSLRALGYRPLSAEGIDSGRWALLDYGDAVLHIFHMEARPEFDLEGMWVEAPRLELDDKPDALYGHFALSQFKP